VGQKSKASGRYDFINQNEGTDTVKPGPHTAFSVVVPVFTEKENLEPLHTRLVRAMGGLKRPYEIIYVHDGSSDGSFQIS